MSSRQRAKRLLVHYFKLVFDKSENLKFNNDNRVEIEEIIDKIFDEMECQKRLIIEEIKNSVEVTSEGIIKPINKG